MSEPLDDPEEWGDEATGAEWTPETASHASAVRTLQLALAAAALLAIGVLVLVLGGEIGGDDDDGDPPAVTTVAGADDPVLEAAAAVGPEVGALLAEYAPARAQALEEASGARVAVVSVTSYRSLAAAEELATAGGVQVLAHLVALPGAGQEVVTGDLAAWAESRLGPAEEERAALAEILPTVEEGSEFIPIYEADLARLDAVVTRLQPGGDLVFGMIVRTDSGNLRLLARQAEVRLVDVAPDGSFDAARRYVGLRPEELDVAGTPSTRPL